MIYLYVGLGMVMMLPIMVGLQVAISVSESELEENAFQQIGGKTYVEWARRLDRKKSAYLEQFGDGAEVIDGYEVRGYTGSDNGFCLVPKNSAEKCPQEY